MTACPICRTEATQKRQGTPYFTCPNCSCWFQSPFPPKTFIADFEGDPAVMSDGDKAVNRALADRLFKTVMGSKPGRTLDIGAKLPVFAAALDTHGCQAWAVEHEPIKHDLPVTMIQADFENDEREWEIQKFDFISLIHTFEHFNDPLAVIRKLRRLVADGGAVFIRMPDHGVSGFERDLTDGHYAIHPYYHSLSSILQCLHETSPTFQVADTWAMEGYGQRDIILRPLAAKPTIALGMIVKNEEKDLPRLLASVKGVADRLCLIDTGSTDKTMFVAQECGIPGTIKRYTGASRKDQDGDWKLEDFSKARNFYLGEAMRAGCDWVLNLDADDELTTPAAIRRATYLTYMDAFSLWIKDGGMKWLTHRLWKSNVGIRFEGRAHEYPNLDGRNLGQLNDCLIVHHGEPGVGQEDSNARNLRILTLEWQEKPTARCAFYLANTHRDAGRWKEALEWYEKRIAMGDHYRDEWLFAHLYGGRCARNVDKDKALDLLRRGFKQAPEWMEFPLELARIAHDDGRYAEAIMVAKSCVDAPIPATQLWREPNAYTDQPARLVSICYEQLGNLGQALAWSEIAQEKIGAPDPDWATRHRGLRQRLLDSNALPLTYSAKPRIALHRPGAIGDILMTLNLIPMLKSKYPDHAIDYFCAPEYLKADALGGIILAAGCDMVYHSEALRSQAGNYRQVFNLVGYPLQEGYPEKPMRQHLLRYFADELRLPLYDDMLPVLSLPKPEPTFPAIQPYLTLQRKPGWSKYKTMTDERWLTLIDNLIYAGIPIIELAEDRGRSLAESIALFANARAHLGIDSWANHASHFLWDGKRVPAVILWGSTQPTASGYPENINISLGLPCSPCFRETHPASLHPRGPCINLTPAGDHRCMADLDLKEVVDVVLRVWRVGSDDPEAEIGRNRIAGDDADRVDAGNGRHA